MTLKLIWKKLSEKKVSVGPHRTFLKRRYRLPNGHADNFYILKHPRVIAALVITSKKNIVLAKQFRPGHDKVFWELPGGAVDPKETPRRAAMREVLEETGYRGKIRYLGQSANDAWSTLWRYHFLITDAQQIGLPKNESTEITEPIEVNVKKFRQLMKQGKLTDIETAYRGLEALGWL